MPTIGDTLRTPSGSAVRDREECRICRKAGAPETGESFGWKWAPWSATKIISNVAFVTLLDRNRISASMALGDTI